MCLICYCRPDPVPFPMSIAGKLPEWIDPWLDSELSPGWIVCSFIGEGHTITFKAGAFFFLV